MRKYIRFKTDKNTIVNIDIEPYDENQFITKSIGLVINESQKGFSAVVLKETAPMEGNLCRVKVGNLAILKSKVVWVGPVDEEIYRIGFELLE